MTEPAIFAVQRSGRIEVTLGQHLVGTIEPWDGPQVRTGNGKIGAFYRITLPVAGGPAMVRPVRSVRLARRLILHRLAEWFEAAGPIFAPVAESLAAQAELEREAA